jgi:hypothetical protein
MPVIPVSRIEPPGDDRSPCQTFAAVSGARSLGRVSIKWTSRLLFKAMKDEPRGHAIRAIFREERSRVFDQDALSARLRHRILDERILAVPICGDVVVECGG